jgi:hypothetical protein
MERAGMANRASTTDQMIPRELMGRTRTTEGSANAIEVPMPAVTEEARDRAKAHSRAKYAEEKKLIHSIDTRGAYRGPMDGNHKLVSEGRDARCACGELFGPRDFETDSLGRLIEPTRCWRCVE